MKVAILGKGSFGKAIFELLLYNKDIDVHHWSRSDGIDSLKSCVQDTKIIFIVIPSTGFRETCIQIAPYVSKDAAIVSCTKGLELPKGLFMSDIIAQELKNNQFAVMSGPNLADEIMKKQIAGAVVASENQEICLQVQDILSSKIFRVYRSKYPRSVELGSVLKNIYAILCGIACGLDYGMNTRSMIMARGLNEMLTFAYALNYNLTPLIGLSGIGDLIATCNSEKSRNFSLGLYLAKNGQNFSREGITETVEGINSVLAIYNIIKERNIDMPLVESLAGFFHNKYSIQEAIINLMNREQNIDVKYIFTTRETL